MRKYLMDMRETRQMSQQAVAQAVNLSRQYYQMIESGERQKRMDIVLAEKLANAFGVDLQDILNEEKSYILALPNDTAETDR